MLPWEEVPTSILQAFSHHLQKKTAWISLAMSQYPYWVQFPGGKEEQLRAWDIQNVKPSKAIVWDKDKLLSPFL